MTKRFYCTPETAHRLTKLCKKMRGAFYFRTLTRTDNVYSVLCESNATHDVIDSAGLVSYVEHV